MQEHFIFIKTLIIFGHNPADPRRLTTSFSVIVILHGPNYCEMQKKKTDLKFEKGFWHISHFVESRRKIVRQRS